MKTSAKTEKNAAVIERAKSRNHIPWCDDYEKMISGMLYNAFCPELPKARFRAKQLMHRYNTWFPDDVSFEDLTKERERIVREVFGEVGAEPWVEAPFFVDYGCNISIGDKFYANFNMTILDCSLITIGDRVMFGPNVHIYAGTHDVDVESRQAGLEYGKEVNIGDDCWIGGNVCIMPGVSIGKGTTVGAGSTVTRDLPPWSVAVGCPARVVKTVEPVEPARV